MSVTMLPYLIVKNTKETIDFYSQVFGFKYMAHQDSENRDCGEHAEMHFNDAIIMFCSEGAFGSTAKAPATDKFESPITLYFYVDDVDAFYQSVKSHDVKTENEPTDQFYGDRMFSVIDINGYRFAFASKIKSWLPNLNQKHQ